MKTLLLVIILVTVLVLPAFAQNQRITVTGPSGVQGTGQFNPDTGRYSITDTYSGQMTQGQVKSGPFGEVRIQEFPPAPSGLTPLPSILPHNRDIEVDSDD